MNGKIWKPASTFLLTTFLVGPAWAEQRIVRMESRTFSDPLVWDSNYTACLAASDGRVYVGLNQHGKGGTVAVYDPRTDTMKSVGDVNRIAGQTNLWVEPQAKVHTQICEGSDGRIYFGTHLSAFLVLPSLRAGKLIRVGTGWSTIPGRIESLILA